MITGAHQQLFERRNADVSPNLADYQHFHDASIAYAELRSGGHRFALGLTNLFYKRDENEIYEPDGEVELLFDIDPEIQPPIAELKTIISDDLCVYEMILEPRRCGLLAGYHDLAFEHSGYTFRVTREGTIDWTSAS